MRRLEDLGRHRRPYPGLRVTNLTRALEDYKKAGITVVGLAAEGTHEVQDLEVLGGPVVIVVGSEGKGLGRLVGENCDYLVRIPMPGGAESLNAGVAAACRALRGRAPPGGPRSRLIGPDRPGSARMGLTGPDPRDPLDPLGSRKETRERVTPPVMGGVA